jgi:DNA-directed RNA polymerase subunit F
VESYLKSYIERMDPEHLARLVDDLAKRKTNPRTAALKIITEVSSGG